MEYCSCIQSNKSKFILSLISAIIYQFGSQMVVTIGNFCVYFASYIHYKDEWVNMQYGNVMAPIILLLLSSFSPLSGVIEKKIGPRLTLLISSIIIEICFLCYYFQRNLWIFYTISVFIGIGNGLSAGVAIKNACLYYPKKKGIINSLVICIGGLISSLYSYVGEKIINPEKKKIVNKKVNPFYPEDVADKTKYFFILALIVIPVTTIISLILFYKFQPNKIPITNSNTNDNNINNNETNIQNKNKDKETNTKEIVVTFRFWRNMIIVSLMPFWIYFLTATYRAYSPMLGVNQNLISYLPTIITAINSITGLIWALIFDKFGFQIIIKIMSIITIILSIYCTIFIDKIVLYLIGLFVSTLISRVGMMSIINPHIMQVYEFRNYLIIGGFARLFNQLSFFIAGLTSVILSFNYKTADALKTPYRIVAGVGIALSVIGLILSFFENDDKFKFKKDENYNGGALEENNKEEDKKENNDDDKENINKNSNDERK